MIDTFDLALPHGITLNCRATGRPGAPLLVFLHGFPEAAFVWDEVLEHFGDRYRCIAPNLRGFGPSSAPQEPEQYRVKHLLADLQALIAQLGEGAPLEALVAHDWGGAVAWTLFLRELKASPNQQAASAYMNFLCRPDAEKLLAANDYARMWPMFTNMGAADATSREGGGWLTEPVRDQYRAIWDAGLTGGCNYYRASPLRPPLAGDSPVMKVEFPPEYVTVRRPTLVIWGEDDMALPVALIDGLGEFVPDMKLVRVPGASHWIIHERPAFIAAEIAKHLRR